MDKPKKKPSHVVLTLYNLGTITEAKITHEQLDNYETDTRVAFKGTAGKASFKLDRVRELIDWSPSWNCVCQLKFYLKKDCAAWKEWLEQEDKEFQEYKRLKEKFDAA